MASIVTIIIVAVFCHVMVEWNPPIGDPSAFVPDLVKNENRIIFSSIFRF